MKFRVFPYDRSCREVTRLLIAQEDRRLSWHERVSVRMHMTICDACPRLERQVVLMRDAMQRWRSGADSGL